MSLGWVLIFKQLNECNLCEICKWCMSKVFILITLRVDCSIDTLGDPVDVGRHLSEHCRLSRDVARQRPGHYAQLDAAHHQWRPIITLRTKHFINNQIYLPL